MANVGVLRSIFSRAVFGGPVARGAVVSIVIRLCAIALGFVQAVMLAHLMGPQGYGVVAVVTSASTVMAAVALLGLGNFSVREVSRLRATGQFALLRGFVSYSLVFVCLGAVTGGAALVGLGRMPVMALPSEIAWGFALTPLVALLLLLRGISQGLGEIFGSLAPTEMIRPALMVAFLISSLIAGVSVAPNWALFLFAVSNLVALLYAFSRIMSALPVSTTNHVTAVRIFEWLKGSMPFFLFSIILILHAESSTLLLGSLAGPSEAGIFQPALRIATVILIARYALEVPLTPRISEFFEMSRHSELRRLVTQATRVTTFLTATIGLAVVMTAPWILAVFGPEFGKGLPALYWLAIAHVFGVACGPVAQLLNMTGHQSMSAISISLGLVVNVFSSSFLIPEYGVTGAAVGLAAGLSFANGLMLWLAWRSLGFNPSILSVRGSTRRKNLT